jgi:GNAT superfamily N-acetyltransferase
MKEDEMRYLIVHANRTDAGLDDNSPQGFLSFMLTHDSSPSVPVLYVYEIHLAPGLRKLGFGAHLMQVVEDVARSVSVEKVMLTCFVCNEKASAFYEKRGYVKDVISPEDRTTRKKTIRADYTIMSKIVPRP